MQYSLNCQRWAIVLAGGEGERMRPLTSRWFGRHRPKQYCTFTGTRSMLEHTLDRARALTQADRVLTVVGHDHLGYLADLKKALPGKLIEQPKRVDTAPGVFLPLSYVMAADPSATVLIMPSDHYIHPEGRFLEHVDRALLLAERLPDRMIVLAAVPDRPESDYGWIQVGEANPSFIWSSRMAPRQVLAFHEKPGAGRSQEFFSRGYLWNTLIIATKAHTLWDIATQCLPGMTRRFQALRRSLRLRHLGLISAEQEALAVEQTYRGIEPLNLSSDLLQKVPQKLMVLPLVDVEWSDWGTPDRLLETLAKLRSAPAAAQEIPALA